MKMLRFLLCLTISGCSRSMTAAQVERGSHELAGKFANCLVARDFAAAYSLTSAEFRNRQSQTQMKGNYDDVRYQYGTNPSQVSLITDKLPADAKAARALGFPQEVEPSQWRAWLRAQFIQAGKPGFEARLLIVEDQGQLKLGQVDYAPKR